MDVRQPAERRQHVVPVGPERAGDMEGARHGGSVGLPVPGAIDAHRPVDRREGRATPRSGAPRSWATWSASPRRFTMQSRWKSLLPHPAGAGAVRSRPSRPAGGRRACRRGRGRRPRRGARAAGARTRRDRRPPRRPRGSRNVCAGPEAEEVVRARSDRQQPQRPLQVPTQGSHEALDLRHRHQAVLERAAAPCVGHRAPLEAPPAVEAVRGGVAAQQHPRRQRAAALARGDPEGAAVVSEGVVLEPHVLGPPVAGRAPPEVVVDEERGERPPPAVTTHACTRLTATAARAQTTATTSVASPWSVTAPGRKQRPARCGGVP